MAGVGNPPQSLGLACPYVVLLRQVDFVRLPMRGIDEEDRPRRNPCDKSVQVRWRKLIREERSASGDDDGCGELAPLVAVRSREVFTQRAGAGPVRDDR